MNEVDKRINDLLDRNPMTDTTEGLTMSTAIGIVIAEQLGRIADTLERLGDPKKIAIEGAKGALKSADATILEQQCGPSRSIRTKLSIQMQPEIIEMIELQKRSAELTRRILHSLKIESEPETDGNADSLEKQSAGITEQVVRTVIQDLQKDLIKSPLLN